MLTHFGAHLALRHAVRAREVKLERIDACVLNHPGQFLPTTLVVLFHDRGNQNVVGVILFDLAKFFQPDVNGPIGNQFDVLETDHLAI